jgi:hypothetical protein
MDRLLEHSIPIVLAVQVPFTWLVLDTTEVCGEVIVIEAEFRRKAHSLKSVTALLVNACDFGCTRKPHKYCTVRYPVVYSSV